MARRCAMCFTKNRADLEARIFNGEPIQNIANEIHVNQSAVYRHLRLHARSDLTEQLKTRGASVHVADMAERLVGLLRDADDVRVFARETADPRLILQAAQSELAAVMALTTKLGIGHTDVIDEVREAQALVAACVEVLPDYPEVLRRVADAAAQRPHGSELAAALRSCIAPSTGPAAPRPIPQKEPTS